jgi:tRNA dimethylallyltransferase
VSGRRSEVIAVFGPTASGKTEVAEIVADSLGTEVVSADALQVYRELPVLTNQPRRPTRLVGIRSVAETMSVGEYARLSHAAIDELVASSGSAVVAGGTGLYLRAALADLDIPPPARDGARARWESAYDADPESAYAELGNLDPAAAAGVHPNDRRRVVRALELAEQGASLARPEGLLWTAETRRPTLFVGLDVPAAVLEQRIRARTARMFEEGVMDEVHAALRLGVSATAEKALGLHDIVSLPPAQALERLFVRTRRYAAYQRKWLRRLPGVLRVDADRPAAVIAAEIVAAARVPATAIASAP